MSPQVLLHGVEVWRGHFHLGPVTLAIQPGEYLVVVGPSGAGKTVLLETIAGWLEPSAGTVSLGGKPLASVPPRTRRCAFLSQKLPLLPSESFEENLRFGVACRGERADPKLEAHLLEILALTHCRGRRDVRTLSRGEQQRLALAQALLTRPQLLLLDEPTTALDPHKKPELWHLLRALHREFRCTVVHVTHDRNEAFFLGERIAVLLAGKLHQVAPPPTLYHHPADLSVARFFAPENLWPIAEAVAEGATLRVTLASVPVALWLPAGKGGSFVGIRPEEVAIIDPQRPLGPQVQTNLFSAVVEDLVFLDGQSEATLRTHEGLAVTARLPLCSALDRGLSAGQRVTVCLKPRSLYLVSEKSPA